MADSDKYRANADYCLRMANKALNQDDEQVWRNMAETWLGMIPEKQRKPSASFEKPVRKNPTS